MGGAVFYKVVGCLHLTTVTSVCIREIPQVQTGFKSPNTGAESVQAAPFFARKVTARRVVCERQHVSESAYGLLLLPLVGEPNLPAEVLVLNAEGLGEPDEGFPIFEALSGKGCMYPGVERV